MRSDLALRHNAGVGALVGLAVGDSLSQSPDLPAAVCGSATQVPRWGAIAERSFSRAETMLKNEPLDMGLSPTDIVACAVGLASPDASPPLLADSDAVLVCALVREGLSGRLDLSAVRAGDPATQAAVDAVAQASNAYEAMTHAPRDARALTGALSGLRWGPAAIPAAWSTTVHGPVGTNIYQLRQVRRLAERLMGQDAPAPPEPRRSLGPREVAPGLWLSNLHAVPKFAANHPDGAIISLCPTTGAFDDHPLRREFALHDGGASKVNPLLGATVDEILATITAFHDEGRPVLVHCHHGASRTGLVLRSWLIQEHGLGEDDATTEAQVRWPKTSTWNRAFATEVKRRAAAPPTEL